MQSMHTDHFEPTWESLEQYVTPEWFRDAKFGIWAHWGPQCQPQHGDWYARNMYSQGHGQYQAHLDQYGHPSRFGFKDVIREWKAENWNPDQLVALYKRAGARYFVAMANHHDNLDLWDSRHQPWNSVAIGPQKNIVDGWARAARHHGLHFGVSVHAAHAWLWYETAQGADKDGPMAGVPYDGKLTKADGAGTWWEGLDPQALYAQSHAPSPDFQDLHRINDRWHWTADSSIPDAAYCENFHNRTVDLIDTYQPDLIYFDDTALPLWPISDVGLKIAAHYYNSNMRRHGGTLEAVLFGKILDEQQRRCMVWDIERGQSHQIEPLPWQTDTCIGSWHYDHHHVACRNYKTARTVIHALIDIVSKNGNLLLSIPLRGDGAIDEQEAAIVEDIAVWMNIHGEAIYATRPWKVFGEGPAMQSAPQLNGQGFNEGKGKPFTAEDIRFTCTRNKLYALVLGWPTQPVRIRSLGTNVGLLDSPIANIRLLGSDEQIAWSQMNDHVMIQPPARQVSDIAAVFEITSDARGR
jgi:alpha-L-fucosidase